MKDTGIPNLFQSAVIFRAFNDELHPTKPPRIVQKRAPPSLYGDN